MPSAPLHAGTGKAIRGHRATFILPMAQTGRQHCTLHGAWKSFPYTTLQYGITRPGQRDENGSYSLTPRSASCRRTRRQGSARNTQTEPCQSAEAGTAAQILPSQADALGYFAPRQNIQLGSSSKHIRQRGAMAESRPQRPTDEPGQSGDLMGGIAVGRVAALIVRHHPRPGCLHRHQLRSLRPERRPGPDLGRGPSAGAPERLSHTDRTVRLNVRGGMQDAGRLAPRGRLGAEIRRKIAAVKARADALAARYRVGGAPRAPAPAPA